MQQVDVCLQKTITILKHTTAANMDTVYSISTVQETGVIAASIFFLNPVKINYYHWFELHLTKLKNFLSKLTYH